MEIYTKDGYCCIELFVNEIEDLENGQYNITFNFYDDNGDIIYIAGYVLTDEEIDKGYIIIENIPYDFSNAYVTL